jgi:uncharacterized protein
MSCMDKKQVIVAYATPSQQWEIEVNVAAFANVAIVIRQSGILDECKQLRLEELMVGIFSQRVSLDTAVNDGDRIEIYRPLIIDPKQARRNRARKKL